MVFLDIKENIGYISVDANIGVIKLDKKCILIDAGGSKKDGQEIARLLDEENLSPSSVIITHGHWDHFYGISEIKKMFPELKVYSSSVEKSFIENPYLEFYSYFSSTSPLKMPDIPIGFKGITVDGTIDDGIIEIDGESMEIIPFSGHSPLGIGILYKEVLFSGDCLYSIYSLNMFKMPFYTDIENQFKDLDRLSNYEIDYCLPSHGLPIRGVKDFKNALIENRKKLVSLERLILELIKEKKSEEQLKKEIAEKLSIKFDLTKYIYVTITTKAFLHYFYNTGKADFEIEDGILFWKN